MSRTSGTKKTQRREARERTRRWLWLNEAQVAMGWFLVLGLAALLGTIYLSQASRIAATGRRMQILQDELEELQRQNAGLERDIAAAQQLGRLQEEAERMGFRPAGPEELEYLVVEDYPVAPPPRPTAVPTSAPPPDTINEAFWLLISSSVNNMVTGESREP